MGWWFLGGIIALSIGLRFEVGTDWWNYIAMYFRPAGQVSFVQALGSPDPGFFLFNWFAQTLGFGYWSVNLLAGVVFTAGLVRFVRRLPEPLVAFTAAIPYMAIVVAMNYTRQALAIGFVLWALPYLYDRRLLAYLVTVTAGALFHKSAIIFVPLMALAGRPNDMRVVLGAGVASGVVFGVLLASRFDSLWRQYVESEFSHTSEGAPLRVAMNAFPAAVWLIIARKVELNRVERRVWAVLSIMSLVGMVLVFQAPAAVDRVALYFSPLQLMCAAYLIRFVRPHDRVLARIVVLAVYALVQYVWLVYASHSPDWFPYRVWPFLTDPGPAYD
ncbi:MAG: hypothetical protein CMN27_08065 [Salinisphaera sp.]|nr:hypothetical protein [Salinisphaera sp.]